MVNLTSHNRMLVLSTIMDRNWLQPLDSVNEYFQRGGGKNPCAISYLTNRTQNTRILSTQAVFCPQEMIQDGTKLELVPHG